VSDSQPTARLDRWLSALVTQGGSDLLLVDGAPVSIRREGEVRALESNPLRATDIEEAVVPALNPHARQLY